MPEQKYTQKIQIHLAEYFSFEVSDTSEVPWIDGIFFNLVKEVKLIRVRSITRARVYQQYFSKWKSFQRTYYIFTRILRPTH